MRSHHLQVLRLTENASKEEIKSAYRELSKRYHPDVNSEAGAHEKFLEIKAAYEYLTDERPDPQLDDYFQSSQTQQPSEEEIWRAEQRRKNKEKEQERERQQALLIMRLIRYFRPVAWLILTWNVLLTVDYLLPYEQHDQNTMTVLQGVEYKRGGNNPRYDRIIFEEFEMKFEKGELPRKRDLQKIDSTIVEATTIFRKPMAVYITQDGNTNRYQQVYNVYIIFGYLIPIMLIMCGLFFYFKKPPYRLNVAILMVPLTFVQLIFFISQ
ncbi:MAG: DnaJ domain-containing protein [Cytophagales bacterium]|nr:DnaJ domain-containing protein [Cytophagales bacterium]